MRRISDKKVAAGIRNGNALGHLNRASSTLNQGVQSLQFRSGIVDFELPVNSSLFGVRLVGLDFDFALQAGQFADSTDAQTLTGQATEFAFGNVQPTAVLGRVTKVNPLHIRTRDFWREFLLERPFCVRVEIVADQCYLRALGVS